MKKQNEDIVAEIRKRQPDKPLSLTELATIREISYIDLKKEKAVLDLLILYCCDCKCLFFTYAQLDSKLESAKRPSSSPPWFP